MQRWRRILFATFVLAYAVLLPLLILHALGYSIRSFRGSSIVETGGIFVASSPPGALLSLDGRPQHRATPLSLLSVAPGTHQVSLALPGYRPWSTPVGVKPGQVTTVTDALLIPVKWAQGRISAERFTGLLSFGSPWLLVEKGPRVRDIFVYDIRASALFPLVEGSFSLREAEVISFTWSQDGPMCLLQVWSGGARRTLQVVFESPRPRVSDVTRFVVGADGEMIWSAGNSRDIFLLHDDSVRWMQMAGTPRRALVASGALGFGASGGAYYLLDSSQALLRGSPPGQPRETIHAFDGVLSALMIRGFVRITPLGPDFLLFHDDDGDFAAAMKSAWFSASAVRGFAADAAAGVVMFWQKQRLGLLDFNTPLQKAHAVRPAFDPIDVDARDIRQAFLVHGDTHILFKDADSVLITETKRSEERPVREVVTVLPGTMVHYEEADGRLFFLDSRTGALSAITIVSPQPSIAEILLSIGGR